MSRISIIQQWQYVGAVNPELLKDDTLAQCRDYGIDSLQSYVLWSEIEKQPGRFDFSVYDVLVDKLARHGLTWTPFLIFGPYYATPAWFQQSPAGVYARCREHHQDSKIQSIWNPHLPEAGARFLAAVAGHYGATAVVDSVLLGISGNWGEAIYPATGCFIGDFHTHFGWWCDDAQARADFQAQMLRRYGALDRLNAAWGTAFPNPAQIDYPPLAGRVEWVRRFSYGIWKHLPGAWRRRVALAKSRRACRKSPAAHPFGGDPAIQRGFDFVEWYLGSMSAWAELWLKTGRRFFPDRKLYLVTGGSGLPVSGADFSAQAKAAARYGGGIRLTNLTDNYLDSFVMTRLMSAACRFYQADYGTEEAGINSPAGVQMRIFDALTSGARQAYFKGLIGLGPDRCTGLDFPLGKPTRGAEMIRHHRPDLQQRPLRVEVAVYYPGAAIMIQPELQKLFFDTCAQLRYRLDFDLLDDRMIGDGALASYRFFGMFQGDLRAENLRDIVRRWIQDGGVCWAGPAPWVAGSDAQPARAAKPAGQSERVLSLAQGWVVTSAAPAAAAVSILADLLINADRRYPWQGPPGLAGRNRDSFGTHFSDAFALVYDTRRHELRFAPPAAQNTAGWETRNDEEPKSD